MRLTINGVKSGKINRETLKTRFDVIRIYKASTLSALIKKQSSIRWRYATLPEGHKACSLPENVKAITIVFTQYGPGAPIKKIIEFENGLIIGSDGSMKLGTKIKNADAVKENNWCALTLVMNSTGPAIFRNGRMINSVSKSNLDLSLSGGFIMKAQPVAVVAAHSDKLDPPMIYRLHNYLVSKFKINDRRK